jgi:hypothetical protein
MTTNAHLFSFPIQDEEFPGEFIVDDKDDPELPGEATGEVVATHPIHELLLEAAKWMLPEFPGVALLYIIGEDNDEATFTPEYCSIRYWQQLILCLLTLYDFDVPSYAFIYELEFHPVMGAESLGNFPLAMKLCESWRVTDKERGEIAYRGQQLGYKEEVERHIKTHCLGVGRRPAREFKKSYYTAAANNGDAKTLLSEMDDTDLIFDIAVSHGMSGVAAKIAKNGPEILYLPYLSSAILKGNGISSFASLLYEMDFTPAITDEFYLWLCRTLRKCCNEGKVIGILAIVVVCHSWLYQEHVRSPQILQNAIEALRGRHESEESIKKLLDPNGKANSVFIPFIYGSFPIDVSSRQLLELLSNDRLSKQDLEALNACGVFRHITVVEDTAGHLWAQKIYECMPPSAWRRAWLIKTFGLGDVSEKWFLERLSSAFSSAGTDEECAEHISLFLASYKKRPYKELVTEGIAALLMWTAAVKSNCVGNIVAICDFISKHERTTERWLHMARDAFFNVHYTSAVWLTQRAGKKVEDKDVFSTALFRKTIQHIWMGANNEQLISAFISIVDPVTATPYISSALADVVSSIECQFRTPSVFKALCTFVGAYDIPLSMFSKPKQVTKYTLWLLSRAAITNDYPNGVEEKN